MKKHLLAGTFTSIATIALTVIIFPPPTLYPTDADQCKQGGWEQYGIFKNQGDCVSYVVTDGRNAPAGALLGF